MTSAFRKKPTNTGEAVFGFEDKYEAEKNEMRMLNMAEGNEARRTIKVGNANLTREHKMSLSDFKIVDKIGSGAFGSVYLVCPKKTQAKNISQAPLFALKILEKETVIK